MTPTALIDTNLLVYLYDKRDPVRQSRAKYVLNELHSSSAGFISVKAISEFFVVIRRIPNGLSAEDALQQMQYFRSAWTILDLTVDIAIEAARGVRDYGFSYWDGQMWATAKYHKINAVFSEDMNVGSVIEQVQIINPLAASFDLSKWLSGDE